MSDHRWTDVDAHLDSAITQLRMALRTFDRGGFDSSDPDVAWEKSNAFLHGMESGDTLIEKAIQRILAILDETEPSGDGWHKDLIDRVSRANARRARQASHHRRRSQAGICSNS